MGLVEGAIGGIVGMEGIFGVAFWTVLRGCTLVSAVLCFCMFSSTLGGGMAVFSASEIFRSASFVLSVNVSAGRCFFLFFNMVTISSIASFR